MIFRVPTLALLLVLSAPVSANEPVAPARWIASAKAWFADKPRPEAGQWLARIGPALVKQDYQGTLVMVSGSRIETFGVFHAYMQGHERMRLTALTGPHREVIRNDALVMCIGTGIGPVAYDADTVGRWNPVGQFADAHRFVGYQARLGGMGRVAGRDAQLVELRAKDAWRYGYQLWLDAKTALPLRVVLLDGNGQGLEQMVFTQIEIGKRPAERNLQPSTAKGLRRVQTLSPGTLADPGWRVEGIPAGFALRSARRLGESVQLLYGDGLANVSVYIEPVAKSQRGESASQRGAVNVHSFWSNGRRVVAIGKVPAATVEYFARHTRAASIQASR